FFSSRRRHTRFSRDWSSDVCSSDLGSYESLFSKRAIKYKTMELKNKALSEKDYQKLILEEYTFLKRPVIIINDAIFVGNSAKTRSEERRVGKECRWGW